MLKGTYWSTRSVENDVVREMATMQKTKDSDLDFDLIEATASEIFVEVTVSGHTFDGDDLIFYQLREEVGVADYFRHS
ncbi:uncharacterized protein FIESC28_05579 [Fusarium coffeatum]|uniref:Uncharacterized protein n=1 Tax=Fusarium coffeatum TaxID=231269 RepID=A0A366RQT7_9HYPO|nr:uncharacterized protein FIESC28_05579 [Fusarium coffeatum]RBR19469.1 hypothetical protein FIESC28_05579 [Fusarium coffeatum]